MSEWTSNDLSFLIELIIPATVDLKIDEIEKLQKQYEKLMKDWHTLSSTNRAESDKKYAEAQAIFEKIDALKS